MATVRVPAGSDAVGVLLTGVNPITGETEFTAQLSVVGSAPAEYRPDRFHAVLTLRMRVAFPGRRPLEMRADITGFQGLFTRLKSRTVLEADVRHLLSSKKKCHLICFENGATSDGPCLTCPDGEYQVRICC